MSERTLTNSPAFSREWITCYFLNVLSRTNNINFEKDCIWRLRTPTGNNSGKSQKSLSSIFLRLDFRLPPYKGNGFVHSPVSPHADNAYYDSDCDACHTDRPKPILSRNLYNQKACNQKSHSNDYLSWLYPGGSYPPDRRWRQSASHKHGGLWRVDCLHFIGHSLCAGFLCSRSAPVEISPKKPISFKWSRSGKETGPPPIGKGERQSP